MYDKCLDEVLMFFKTDSIHWFQAPNINANELNCILGPGSSRFKDQSDWNKLRDFTIGFVCCSTVPIWRVQSLWFWYLAFWGFVFDRRSYVCACMLDCFYRLGRSYRKLFLCFSSPHLAACFCLAALLIFTRTTTHTFFSQLPTNNKVANN